MVDITVPTVGQPNWGPALNTALEGLESAVTAAETDIVRLEQACNNVKAFGAVGDGVTDDTAAVQAAINAGGITFLPASTGAYICTTLQPKSGTVLQGTGRSGYIATSPDQASTIKLKSGTNAALINGADQVSNVVIRNLNFDGNKAGNTSGNIINLASGSAQDTAWHIVDCFLDNSANDGIFIGTGRQAVQVTRTWIMRSDNNGSVINGNDSHFHDVLIGLSGSNGMYIGAGVQHITDCDVWSSTAHGIVVENASMVSLSGIGIDRHQQSGVAVVSGEVTIRGCLFHSNSQQTNNTYPHIRVDAGQVAVTGCVFGTDGFANNPNYAISATGTAQIRESSNSVVTGSVVTGFFSDVTKVVSDAVEQTPYDHGLNAWTHDPYAAASQSTLTNGTVYVVKLMVRRPCTIDTLWWVAAAAAVTPTASQNWIGLYSSAGTKLAEADIGTASTSVGTKSTTITAQVLQPGFVWVAFLGNAATPVQLLRGSSFESSPNVNLATAERRSAVAATGQTALPASITPGSLSTSGSLTLFAGLSQ